MAESVLMCLCSDNGPTRRTLFGPMDRDQLLLDYSQLMKNELQEASHRWNFDFSTNKPLQDGDYEWTEISGVFVPALYREGKLGAMPHLNGPNSIFRLEKVSDEKTAEKSHIMKRKQTSITGT